MQEPLEKKPKEDAKNTSTPVSQEATSPSGEATLTYIQYISLPRKEQLKYKFLSGLHNFGRGFINFFVKIGLFFVNFGKRFWSLMKDTGYAFKHGDVWTRLSFVFIGSSHIARGQVLKGICLMLIEFLFIFYMVMSGGTALYKLASLGTKSIHYYCSLDGSTIASGYESYVFTEQSAAVSFCNFYDATGDGAPGDWVSFFGDNSSLCLLFGLIAVLICIGFLTYYFKMVKASIHVQEMKEAHQHLNTAFEDLKELLDKKFYLTLLFLPVLGVVVFTIIPLIDMIMVAFTNDNLNHQYPSSMFTWIGLSNFANLFGIGGTSSTSNFSYTFVHILGWTLVWAVFATFLNYFLGMLLAMLINKKGIKVKKLWRTMFVMSIAVPQFVSLMTWNKFLSTNGLVEQILKAFGWMGSADHVTVLDYATSARVAVILIDIWIGVPYTILITSGILMNIPADLYESAQIDGAKPATTYFKITLPYILFVTGPYLITQFVGNINNFNVIYFLTGGAPTTNDYMSAGKTDLLVTWLYKLTVNETNYAFASVIGIMVFVVSAFFSLIAFRFSSANKNEEDFA